MQNFKWISIDGQPRAPTHRGDIQHQDEEELELFTLILSLLLLAQHQSCSFMKLSGVISRLHFGDVAIDINV